jgi:hypothetical protein
VTEQIADTSIFKFFAKAVTEKDRTGVCGSRHGGVARRKAMHSNAKSFGLYARRNDDISVGEGKRVGI